MEVVVRQAADRAIKQQYRWYEKCLNKSAADHFYEGIMADIVRISSNPNIGRVDLKLHKAYPAQEWRGLVSGRRFKLIYYIEQGIIFIAYIWDNKMSPHRLSSIIKKRG